MVCLTMLLLGGLSLRSINISLLPDIAYPRLTVITSYEGLPPNEIRNLITLPLEDSFSSLKNLREMESLSRNGMSIIHLEFQWGTNNQIALVETKEIIDRSFALLPEQSNKPMVFPYDPSEEALFILGVFPKNNNISVARNLSEKEIKTRLQQLEGIGSVTVTGGTTQEIQILLDQSQMTSMANTVENVSSFIRNYNQEIPAGSIRLGNMDYIVKTDSRIKTLDELGQLMLPSQNGGYISLDEIATIDLIDAEQNSIFLKDGIEGIAISIRKTPEYNPIVLSQKLQEEIEWLNQYFHRDVEIMLVLDNTKSISKSLKDISMAGILGALAAFIILFIFLKNVRSAIILTITIPLSMIGSLLCLKLLGRSINLMSMGGMILGIGMVVDNSVVILDHLIRKCLDHKNINSITTLVNEMASSTMGSTLTSIIVFIPVIFIPGLLGALFSDMALAVCFSLLFSFILSVTLIPVLFHLNPKKIKIIEHGRIEQIYRKLLRFSLRKPFVLVISILVLVSLGTLSGLRINKEFMNEMNQNQLTGRIILPAGTNIDFVKNTAISLSEQIMHLSLTDQVLITAGGEGGDPFYLSDPEGGKETLDITILLKPNNMRLEEQISMYKPYLETNMGRVSLSAPKNLLSEILNLNSQNIEYRYYSDNTEDIESMKNKIENYLANTEHEYYFIPEGSRKYYELIPRKDIMNQYQLTPYSLSMTTGSSLHGMGAGNFDHNGKEIPIIVKLQEKDRLNANKLDQLRILVGEAGSIPISSVAERNLEDSPPMLLRQNRKDMLMFFSSKSDNQLQEDLQIVLTEQSNLIFKENQENLIIAFSLALVLLYFLLVSQFQSFTMPIRLMAILPLSLFALLLGLNIFGMSLNLNSSLGFLVLLGLIINNSIILFETYRNMNKTSYHPIANVIYGSIDRIRPILITTFTTVIAMIPTAIDPLRKTSQSSMAVAIICGLSVTTLLSLFLIPSLFIRYYHKGKNEEK